MEKFAVWVVACLLTYICLILTSISGKLDELSTGSVEFGALNEVKPQSSDLKEHRISLYQQTETSGNGLVQAVMIIAAVIAVVVSWHLSRIYYCHQWTKRLLRKTHAYDDRIYAMADSANAIHPDQDCVGDPPRPDGRIKDSWLPAHVHEYRKRGMRPQR